MDTGLVGTPLLIPKYLSRFSCLGSTCEDSCCVGGPVMLDGPALQRLKGNQDPELKPLTAMHVKEFPSTSEAAVEGWIEPLSDDCLTCPFLDRARLCRIQSNLTEMGLPDGCAAYPRTAVQLGDVQQVALRLSCPEAARLALLEEDALDLEAREIHLRGSVVDRISERAGISLEGMCEVRTQMFQILSTRELDLSLRLAVLGVFCQRLNELIEQGKSANLVGLFQIIDAVLENGALQIPLKPQKDREYLRARLSGHFLPAMRKAARSPQRVRVLEAAMKGLGILVDGRPSEVALMRGLSTGTERLNQALSRVPWLLENHLQNAVLREVFPWSKGSPFQHFMDLTLGFAILRTMLAGRAAMQEAILTPDELAETVQVFCSIQETKPTMLDLVEPGSIEGDWSSLGMLLLVV